MRIRSTNPRPKPDEPDRAFEFASQFNDRFWGDVVKRSYAVAVRERGLEWLRESKSNTVAMALVWAERMMSREPPAERPRSYPEPGELRFPGDDAA